ncbi:MAG: DEAD/DEAH box helicase family protein [Rhodospirillales bacterium]|nr:DEAD/DEAH box helicase family protein [Rhodospirillales bacterium]USO07932.1 MAG: DEAD/DEAH box helicase family protein [Rhodospirillales bacterium]
MNAPVPTALMALRLRSALERRGRGDDLYDTQKLAIERVAGDVLNGERQIYVEKPAGSGKGRLGLEIINPIIALGDVRAIYAVPTNKLLNQTLDEIRTYFPQWIAQGKVGIYNKDSKTANAAVTLTTHTSLALGTGRGVFSPARHGVLVLDEGHGMISARRQELTAQYGESLIICLTASAEFSAEKSLAAAGYHESYRLGEDEAVKRRINAPYRNLLLMTAGIEMDDVRILPTGDFDPAQLAKATDQVARYRQIADTMLHWKDPEGGPDLFTRTSIGFCATIDQSESAAAHLNKFMRAVMPEGTVFARAMHSGLSPRECNDLDEAFRAREIRMMITPRLWAEGYNNRAVSLVFNIVPTLSQVRAKQRGGRAMRIDPANPTLDAIVIDVMDRGMKQRGLLYAEAVGGARFYKEADIPPQVLDQTRFDRALKGYWRREEKAARLIAPQALIDDYVRAMEEKSAALSAPSMDLNPVQAPGARTVVVADKILPSLRLWMNEGGYRSVREIYHQWKALHPEAQIDYHVMLALATGGRGRQTFGQKDPIADSPGELDVFCRLLAADTAQLFRDHPKLEKILSRHWDRMEAQDGKAFNSRFSLDDLLPNVRAALIARGYTSLKWVGQLMRMENPEWDVPQDDLSRVCIGVAPAFYRKDHYRGPLGPAADFLAAFLEEDPQELFSEAQYFKHKKALGKNKATVARLAGSFADYKQNYGHGATISRGNNVYGYGPTSNVASQKPDWRSGVFIDFNNIAADKRWLAVDAPVHPPRWAQAVQAFKKTASPDAPVELWMPERMANIRPGITYCEFGSGKALYDALGFNILETQQAKRMPYYRLELPKDFTLERCAGAGYSQIVRTLADGARETWFYVRGHAGEYVTARGCRPVEAWFDRKVVKGRESRNLEITDRGARVAQVKFDADYLKRVGSNFQGYRAVRILAPWLAQVVMAAIVPGYNDYPILESWQRRGQWAEGLDILRTDLEPFVHAFFDAAEADTSKQRYLPTYYNPTTGVQVPMQWVDYALAGRGALQAAFYDAYRRLPSDARAYFTQDGYYRPPVYRPMPS